MNLRTQKQREGMQTLIHALFQEMSPLEQQEAIARVLVSHEARLATLEDPVCVVPLVDTVKGKTTPPRLQGERTWWTIDEVAEELRVHERTIRRWIHEGKLVAKRVGKHIRIHRFAVTAFLERDPVGPQAQKRRRGGQLKSLPPLGIRQMYEERELRQQEVRAARAQRAKRSQL